MAPPTGTTGNDTLSGSSGNDSLFGDAGDDLFVFPGSNTFSADDTIDGGDGTDTLDISGAQGTVDFTATTLTHVEIVKVTGSSMTRFNAVDATVAAGETLTVDASGMTATFTWDGYSETDGQFHLIGGDVNDTLYGGDGNDTLSGAEGRDFLYGDDGDDVLYGNAGNDGLSGGDGNDTIWGGTGNDTFIASDGDDVLWGGDGKDWMWGQNDNDTLYGGAGGDTLSGNGGNDWLWGEADDDTLSGGSGDDVLWGGEGNDRLMGEAGSDVLHGGAGQDTFYDSVSGFDGDTLGDFSEEDVIVVTNVDLSALDGTTAGETLDLGGGASLTLTGITADSGTFVASYDGFHTTITLDPVVSLTLDVDAPAFTAGDDTVVARAVGVLNTTDTLNGGAGNDTLTLAAAQTVTLGAATLTQFENIVVKDGVQAIVSHDATVAAGETLTVDASASDAALTWDGRAETDGTFALIGGGAGDALTGGAGADTLRGGAGADTLTGGAGKDTFQGSVAELDGDTLTDFSVADVIVVVDSDLSALDGTTPGGTLDLGNGASLTLNGLGAGSGRFAASYDDVENATRITLVAPTPGGGSKDEALDDDLFQGNDGSVVDDAVDTGLEPTDDYLDTTIDGVRALRTTTKDRYSGETVEVIALDAADDSRLDDDPTSGGVDVTLGGVGVSLLDGSGLLMTQRESDTVGSLVDRVLGGAFDAQDRADRDAFLSDIVGTTPVTQVTPVSSAGSQRMIIDNTAVDTGLLVVDARRFGGDDADITINGRGHLVIRGPGFFHGDDTVVGGSGFDDIDNVLGDDSAQTLFFGPGDDIIRGQGGDDSVSSDGGKDLLFGGRGNDTVSGGVDDDRLVGGSGNDTLDGGTGVDVARFTLDRDQVTLTRDAEGRLVVSEANGEHDSLSGVELLRFDDRVELVEAPSLVTASGFDEDFYLADNPDVAAAVSRGDFASGYEHYERYGADEGREGNAGVTGFDEAFYLSQNADVAAAVARGEITALDHYRDYGAHEGRDPNALFDESGYREANPDVDAAIQRGELDSGYQHYQAWGWQEGRDPSAWFDLDVYLESHADIAEAGVEPLGHYLQHGYDEGRVVTAADDGLWS
ncbi:hypothetical protein KGQ96_05945 [Halomonas coralii]|uniref:calcium-binding protein n=1 Tax=Modicisalibacter sp. R2A 31.J TaxID=2831898 RepID=UPI001CCD775B|nr:calcium-binding protein [Modicisalibacter sp. R2A 31.J]MBZ9557601.1 hypothetical protein [Modicisalibacter sp. R2A 31.J]